MMTSQVSSQAGDFTGIVNKDDIFIAVLGLTGSGKSSFITECTGQDATIGHGLASCTTTVSLYSYDHEDRIGKKRKVHLIDTPGFDDLGRSDVEILQEIIFWLSCAYDNGFFLNGVVYLQSIAAPRWTASAQRSLEIFKALCGAQNYKSVVFATTFWDAIAKGDENGAQARYNSLVDVHWNDLKKAGSHIQPASYGYGWAKGLIDHIVGKGTKHILQVQSELQIPGTNLRDTTAGQTAGELWRLDDDRKEGVLELNQSREKLFVHWSRVVSDDIAALTHQIEALRNQIGEDGQHLYHATSSPPPYSNFGKGPEREEAERKRLLKQAQELDRVKQAKLASYGMYVNTAAMVFGGVAAGVALLPLLACNVM